MQEMTGRGDACLQLTTLLPYLTFSTLSNGTCFKSDLRALQLARIYHTVHQSSSNLVFAKNIQFLQPTLDILRSHLPFDAKSRILRPLPLFLQSVSHVALLPTWTCSIQPK